MDTMAHPAFRAIPSPPTSVSWVAYIIIGAIAGWIAGKIVKGRGSGILMNMVVGIIGGFVGRVLLSALGVDVEQGRRWFTFFISLGGAILLLWVVGLVRRRT